MRISKFLIILSLFILMPFLSHADIAGDAIEETELDTFSELQNQITDGTLLKAGTLTDTKYCIWDNLNAEIVCDSTPAGTGDITTVGNCTTADCGIEGGNDLFPFIYEGTANTEETTFSVTDPTADRAIVFPDAGGEISLLGQSISDAEVDDNITASNYLPLSGGTLTGTTTLDDTTLAFEEGVDTLSITTPALTAARAVTFPDAAGEISLLGQSISDTELANDYSGVGSCTNQFVRATNDNAAPTCATVVDADVDDGITVSNYLPLAGGTMTGVLVLDNLGLSQPASDTNPTCGAGDYLIYSDLSDTKWKKCENGVVSDLDTGGGSGDITTVGSCTTGDCAVEGGNDMFPFIYEGTADTIETTFQVTDPASSDKTITFPNATGEVTLLGQTIENAELASSYSGVGSCTNQFPRTLNADAAPTCESITDTDVPDTITVSNYCKLTGGADCTMSGAAVLDDTSLQIQEGVDTMTITVPALTAARAVTFPDAAGEISLLGQTIEDGELASNYSGVGACAADTVATTLNDNAAPTCTSLTDSYIPDTITASNYLPLAGGTLTGQLVTDNLGIDFTDSDTNPTCSAGDYIIYADLSETTLKKCVNGSVSDMDTGGGSGDITTVGTCTTSDCAIEGGNDMFPFIYEGTANTEETTFQVTDPTADRTVTFPDAGGEVTLLGQTIEDGELASNYSGVGSCTNQFVRAVNDNGAPTCATVVDADVDDGITVSNYVPLAGGTMTGPLVLDDTSLQVQEGVDTMTITVPALTAARAVTFPDAAGEVSLLGQSISDTELENNYSGVGSCTNQVVTATNDNAAPTCTTVTTSYIDFDPIEETELDTISELNTQITDATVLTKSDKQTRCFYAGELAAADDDVLMGSWFVAVTITDVWCNYEGSAPTTVAQISLEDGSGNAMTHTTPTCAAPGTAATAQSVSAGGGLNARENLRIDVDNTPNPENDNYTICVAFQIQ